MAARLIQNRTKTGQQKALEPEGAAPAPVQPHAPSGSFDALEVTAVGGPDRGERESPGADKGDAEAAVRKKYPTPGGGLPGLLARTQLGLGDAIRAFRESRESVQRADAAAPTNEDPAAGGSTVAAAPAQAGEVVSAETPPPAPAGEPAAVVASGAGEGAVAVSGPVFELATGPIATSGPVSGPVFDLVSGPFSGPSTTVSAPGPGAVETPAVQATPAPAPEQAAPRPSPSTPASGRLAALLAESRKRTGRHELLDKGAQSSNAGAAPVGAAPDVPPAAGDSVQPVQDVATMRVPGAELAQGKVPGFAATLLGLPAPELTPPVLRTGGVAAGAGGTLVSQARHLRGNAGAAGADRNTPELVEGDATERSLLSSGDMRARWGRNSDEQKRTTDIIDIVRSNRSGIRTAGLILGGAAVLVVILVVVARVNRSGGDETTAVTSARPPVPAASANPTPTRVEDPARTAGAIAPGEARVDPARVGEEGVDDAVRGETKAGSLGEKPVPPAAAEAEPTTPPLPSSFRATESAVAHGNSDGEAKRKVARSESRRSDTRRAEPKTRRRSVEARSARPEGTATAASYEMPRPHVAQPSRPVQADPDGTLPLGMQ